MADTTVAELIEGLTGGSPGVRVRCALSLACSRLRDEEIKELLPSLLVAVKDFDLQVLMNIVRVAGQIGPAAVPALIEALKDDLWSVRKDAAYTLGDLGPAANDAIPALLEGLKDPDSWVCKASARALDRIDPGWEHRKG